MYHHIITLFICWFCLFDYTSVQWIGATANSLVHVPMYYFYACQSVNIEIKWKRYLTQLQIVQFVFDITSSGSWGVMFLVTGVQCRGSWLGFTTGMAIFASFLYLFTGFFKKTYEGKGASKKTAAAPKDD